MSALTIGELFAGYGGLGLGVKAALGGDVAWVSDVCHFDKAGNAGHREPHRAPCSILAHRLPDAPNLGDVAAVDWSSVTPVDVLTGGTPCQDLSHAGKRAGMTEGTRSNLWVAMREAIDTLRPSLVVWENVSGAYSAEADSELVRQPRLLADTRRRDGEPVLRALGRVLGDLASLGYDAAWVSLRAADVGAPHGRLRVFLLAWPAADSEYDGSLASAFQRGADSSAGKGGLLQPQRPPADPRLMPTPTTDDAGNVTRDSGDFQSLTRTVANLLPTPAVNDMGASYTPDTWDAWTDRMKAEHGNGNGHGKSLNIEAQRLLQTPSVADALGGHESRSGERSSELLLNGQAKAMRGAQWGDYAPAIARWEVVLGRPAPAPTMTSTKGNPQLSPAFVEWMMGLPAGWVTDVPGITRNEALKALGNGVVPQQAEAAVRWLWQYVPMSVRAGLLGVAA